ncbi:MAG TPA: preprotein translocase subunit YajC [Candidatus Methylacidiphilales bacterium]|nr:preprotein translocase subunit YajC [Candidatus Methylacidiphilales bacterium]
MSPIAVSYFAQATNAPAPGADASSPQGPPVWTTFVYFLLIVAMVYFAFLRPQSQAKKKQEETLKAAKTGDKVITTSGIHGVITNVKETTVMVRVADNVKLEIEKTHLEKIIRPDSDSAKSAAKT